METYLNDICDSELDIRNTPISDQKSREYRFKAKEFEKLNIKPKKALRLFFRDRILTPAKSFHIKTLEEYLLIYYDQDITDRIIEILKQTYFLVNYPISDDVYFVRFTDYSWLYKETLYNNTNEECVYRYNKLGDNVQDFLSQYRRLILLVSYYSNAYGEDKFLESKALKEIIASKKRIDKLETQVYSSLSEFHAAMDTITNTIERNKDVKNKKIKYKEPVLLVDYEEIEV